MQIICPYCFQEVAANELNVQQMVGKCGTCHKLFSFRGQVENREKIVQHRQSRLSPQPFGLPRPKTMTMTNNGLELLLRWRWFRPYVFHLIPRTLFWLGLVLLLMAPMFIFPFTPLREKTAQTTADFGCFPILLIPHLVIGIWYLYYICCLFINQTSVQVRQGDVVVRHFPLPWRGNIAVPTHQIEQLYVRENRGRKRNDEITYDIRYIDRNNCHAPLVTKLSSAEQALYVEQEVERFLGIIDRPVRGAYR